MSFDIQGDLLVKRTGVAERRFDQGLFTVAALTATYNVLRHSHSWLEVTTDDLGVQNVVLPDATTLPLGWKIVVHNIGAVDNIVVQDNATGTLKTLVPTTDPNNYAYEFVLYDNGTAAGGWYVWTLDDISTQPATRYVFPHNATTDWGSLTGGYYTITVTGATHGRGVYPMIQFWKLDTGVDYLINPDRVAVTVANGNTSFRVTGADAEDSDIDGRYAGNVVFI